jgi:hypothetical protein
VNVHLLIAAVVATGIFSIALFSHAVAHPEDNSSINRHAGQALEREKTGIRYLIDRAKIPALQPSERVALTLQAPPTPARATSARTDANFADRVGWRGFVAPASGDHTVFSLLLVLALSAGGGSWQRECACHREMLFALRPGLRRS